MQQTRAKTYLLLKKTGAVSEAPFFPFALFPRFLDGLGALLLTDVGTVMVKSCNSDGDCYNVIQLGCGENYELIAPCFDRSFAAETCTYREERKLGKKKRVENVPKAT